MSSVPPSEYSELDQSRPLILLLGNVDHEGITSPLKSSREQYKKKLLDSKVDNWLSILEYFDRFLVRATIIKLNTAVYNLLASPGYEKVGDQLLTRIAESRNIVFVFEDLLSGPSSTHDVDTIKVSVARAGKSFRRTAHHL